MKIRVVVFSVYTFPWGASSKDDGFTRTQTLKAFFVSEVTYNDHYFKHKESFDISAIREQNQRQFTVEIKSFSDFTWIMERGHCFKGKLWPLRIKKRGFFSSSILSLLLWRSKGQGTCGDNVFGFIKKNEWLDKGVCV